MKNKLCYFALCLLLLCLPLGVQAENYKAFVVVAVMDDGDLVITDGSSVYLLDYSYNCFSSYFSKGKTFWIDTYFSPGFWDKILVEHWADYETCEVSSAEKLDLDDYYVHSADGDDLIVEDEWGNLYAVELGYGCSGAWSAEGDWISIDVGAGYLDGIGDDAYFLDDGDSCSIWDADEIEQELDTFSSYTFPTIDLETDCPENAYRSSDGSCYCGSGYQPDAEKVACEEILSCGEGYILKNNACVTHTQNCIIEFGVNTHGVVGDDNNSSCYCDSGYQWNSSRTGCESIATTVEIEEASPDISELGGQYDPIKYDSALVERLKGTIILQVDEHGEAWYVNPTDARRYYMSDGSTAYEMMRSFGLGITDSDLINIPSVSTTDEIAESSSICSTNALADRLKGRILLQVEQYGEAWYVHPEKCLRVYMEDGDAAYIIMRFLGLGITNDDLSKMPTGEVE